MEQEGEMSQEDARNRLAAVQELAQTITLYLTPGLLALLGFFLLASSFPAGGREVVRSLAGLLLPVIFGSYLYVFQRKALLFIAQLAPGLGFLIGVGMGALVVGMLGLFYGAQLIPIPELLTSGCFSVLVFSAAAKRDDSGIALFYGVMCGALAYIVVFGWPLGFPATVPGL